MTIQLFGRACTLSLAILILSFLHVQPSVAAVQFTEVTDAAGVGGNIYFSSSNHVLGACWIDFNNDHWPDLFVTNGNNRPPHLFQNDRNGAFSDADHLLPNLASQELAGCVFADYDNDGDSDLYIQIRNGSFSLNGENPPDGPPNRLLKNLWVENGNQVVEGEPLFQEVAAAAGVDGVVDPPFGTQPARNGMTGGFLDYNRDGCVDLYVGQMMLQAGGHPANLDTLYRNNCDGTFDDRTSDVNDGTDPDSLRPALAFIGAHLDSDLWPDMYVVNVHEPAPHFEDLIYRNNTDGTFTEIAGGMVGIGDDAGSGMGIDVADIDHNGTWDVYITDVFNTANDQAPLGNVLYLGNGDGTYQDNSAPEAGVESGFSWGTNFFDADQDGFEDLLVGTRVPQFYLNTGAGTFTQQSVGVEVGSITRGTSIADYDRDGDLDVVLIQDRNNNLKLLRNDSTSTGNWLQLKLVGVASNRDAINAMVIVQAGGMTLRRQVKGGSSAHSQDSLVVHFGLGDATVVDTVDIFWPHTSDPVDRLTDVAVNQLLIVTEGSGTSEPPDDLPPPPPPPPPPPEEEELAVTGVSPNSMPAGSSHVLTVTGTGFETGASLQICQRGTVTVNQLTWISSNELTADVTVSASASAQTCGTRVLNSSFDQHTLASSMTITAP